MNFELNWYCMARILEWSARDTTRSSSISVRIGRKLQCDVINDWIHEHKVCYPLSSRMLKKSDSRQLHYNNIANWWDWYVLNGASSNATGLYRLEHLCRVAESFSVSFVSFVNCSLNRFHFHATTAFLTMKWFCYVTLKCSSLEHGIFCKGLKKNEARKINISTVG